MKNKYWTYLCAGVAAGCEDDHKDPHPPTSTFGTFPCEWMPVFRSKKQAVEALKDAGYDISRIREVKI